MNDKNYVLFLDSVGRTIMGEDVTSTLGEIKVVKNPTTIMVGFNEQQRPKAQMLPVFFRDLLEDPNSPVTADYNISQITRLNVVPSESMINSYERLHEHIKIPEVGIEVVEKENK